MIVMIFIQRFHARENLSRGFDNLKHLVPIISFREVVTRVFLGPSYKLEPAPKGKSILIFLIDYSKFNKTCFLLKAYNIAVGNGNKIIPITQDVLFFILCFM